MTRLHVAAAFVAGLCASAGASAQVPTPPAPIPVPLPTTLDSVASFEHPNGSLMRAASLTYDLSLLRQSGPPTSLGTRTVDISEAMLGGTPAWLIAEARRGTAVETTDSVYLVRADLTPERWASTIGRAQLGASFSRDSIFGAVDTYQGRASFALAFPPNALLSAGMVERVIELLPLRAGYRASATLVLIEGAQARLVPAELSVDREERIQLGDHAVECWLVALRAGALEERLWVTKEQSRVGRTEQALAGGVLAATMR